MLPFMKPKLASTMVIGPSGKDMGKESDVDPGLMSAAEDLISAVHAKDGARVVSALKAAFVMLDSQPEAPASEEGFGDV